MDITTTRVATRALKWTTTRWLIAAHLSWQHDSASQRLRSQTPTGLRPWPFSSTVHEQGKSPRFTLTREQINSKNIRNIQTAASNRCVYPRVSVREISSRPLTATVVRQRHSADYNGHTTLIFPRNVSDFRAIGRLLRFWQCKKVLTPDQPRALPLDFAGGFVPRPRYRFVLRAHLKLRPWIRQRYISWSTTNNTPSPLDQCDTQLVLTLAQWRHKTWVSKMSSSRHRETNKNQRINNIPCRNFQMLIVTAVKICKQGQ